MARRNVSHLDAKPKNRKPKRAGTRYGAFGLAAAIAEDATRSRKVRLTLKVLKKRDREPAAQLAKRLGYSDSPPATLASAAYFYDKRETILDHLVKLTHKLPEGELSTFTLLPRKSRVYSLQTVDPYKMIERLRADLTRAGGRKAKGWLFASIHGEFNVRLGLWDLHYHIAVAGAEMALVVESLRTCRKYRLKAILEDGASADRAPPIRQRSVNRNELRYALSYVLQTWWPETGHGDTPRGRGPRRRLSGVRHTEFLLWLDRQKLHHLYLLFNLEVGRDGVRVKTPIKTRTPIGGGGDH